MKKQERKYAFFSHVECEAFPCHPNIAREDFNCLFCYCPLYPLGEACKGNFTYTETGIKGCSSCSFPHRRESYDAVLRRFPELQRLAAKKAGSDLIFEEKGEKEI